MIVEELIGRLTFQAKGVDQAKAAAKAIGDLRKQLNDLAASTRKNLSGPATGIDRMAKQLTAAAAAGKKAQNDIGAGLGKANASASQHLTIVRSITAAYNDAARSARGFVTAVGGRPPPSWIKSELNSLREYQRLQRRVMSESRRTGIPASRPGHPIRYGDRDHPMGEAVAGGVVAGAAGRATRYAVTQGASSAREGSRQEIAGMTPEEQSRLQKSATDLSAKYPSVDSTTIREMGRDARNMLPSFDMALKLLPDLVKARVMLQAAKGVGAADQELTDFLKGLDIVGKTEDLDSVRRLLNGAIKATAVEGNQLPLREYKNAAKYSKMAGSSISEEFWTEIAPTFMQSEGGARFGTQISAGAASLISKRRTKKSTDELRKLGLLEKNGDVKDASLLSTNPYEWTLKRLMPALQKKKVNVDNDPEVSRAVAPLFSSSMSENEFGKMITQREQVERNRRTYRKAKGLEGADAVLKSDPYVGLEGLIAQLRNFFAVTQEENVKSATSGLAELSKGIGELNKSLSQQPGTAQGVGLGMLGVGGAATGYGSYLVGKRLWQWLTGGSGAAEAGTQAAEKGAKGGGLLSRLGLGTLGRILGLVALLRELGEAKRTTTPENAPYRAPGLSSTVNGKRITGPDEGTMERARRGEFGNRGGALLNDRESRIGREKMRVGAVLEKAKLAEIEASAARVAQSLQIDGKVTVDTSAIDAAQAKADKLVSTLRGVGSAAASAGSAATGLVKGSNGFTGSSATAP